jgi:hypothetical protein
METLKTPHLFKTQAEAEAWVKKMTDTGWTKLPADSPEEARKGYFLFRNVSDTTGEPVSGQAESMDGCHEESETVLWEMFGKPLSPNVTRVKVEEMVQAIRTETVPPVLCDNAKERQLGFVWYHDDVGVAHTRRITLTELKSASKEDQGVVMALRDQLMARPT